MRRLFNPTAFKLALLIGFLSSLAFLAHEAAGGKRTGYFDLLEEKAIDVKFKVRGPLPLSHKVALAAIDERSLQKYGLWPWDRALVAQGLHRLVEAGAASVVLDMALTDRSSDSKLVDELAGSLAPENPALEQAAQTLESRAPASAEASLQAQAVRLQQKQLRELNGRLKAALRTSQDQAMADEVKQDADRLVLGTLILPDDEYQAIPEDKRQAWLREVTPSLVPGPFESDLSGPTPRIRALSGRDAHGLEISNINLEGWIPELAAGGRHFGNISIREDADGTLRHYAPVARSGSAFYPAIGVEGVSTAAHSGIYPLLFGEERVRAVGVYTDDGFREIPADPFDQGRMLIDYIASFDRWHAASERDADGKPACQGAQCDRMSFADAVDGALKKEWVAGKVVFVGATALGTFDQRVTPFDPFSPGVVVHMNVAEDILSNRFISHPGELTIAEAGILLLLGILFGLVLPRLSLGWQVVAFPTAGAAWLAANLLAFTRGVQLFTVSPLVEMAVLTFGLIFFQYMTSDREKREIRKAFQYYLTESVMEEMLKDPTKLKLGGEKKQLTVLFADIRGFTTLSEMLEPSVVARTLNEYLSPMTDLIFQHGGTLDKYMGDAIMAFWGAPMDQADHALRACKAAVAMLGQLDTLRKAWLEQGRPDIDIGVGLNSGLIHVGNMGSNVRFDYTVIGDDVNLASRLEGTNKIYGTRVIIGENTFALVKGQVVARQLGGVMVKGKRKPVTIYELRGIGQPSATDVEAGEAFEQGLAAYRSRDWDAAEAAFNRVVKLWPADGPSEKYLDDIADKRTTPPPQGWDGVYVMKTK